MLFRSDSLSAVTGLLNINIRNLLMYKIQVQLHALLNLEISNTVLWILGHCGIPGNELADQAARTASQRPATFIPVPYTDFYPVITEAIQTDWSNRWSNSTSHLSRIHPQPGRWKKIAMSRKQQVIINRLRLGHSHLTHSYLMDATTHGERPICRWCSDAVLTISHLLITCPSVSAERQRAFTIPPDTPLSLSHILENDADLSQVLHFLELLDVTEEI